MRIPRLLLPLCALAAVAWFAAACGDDDDDPETETTPAATASATATAAGPTPTQGANPPSVTVTVVPTPAGPTSDSLARSPRYILYETGEGDTLAMVAAAFSAASGPAPDAFVKEIRELNKLSSDKLAPGVTLVIPLRLAANNAMMPDTSFEAALGVGGKAGALVLLQPSLKLREGFLGRLVVHRVAIADGTPDREGYGYLIEYWMADRAVFKGGGTDPDARLADPGFIVAAGTYAETLASTRAGDLHRFERDGVQYAVRVLRGIQRPPAELAAQLQTAKER